MTDQAHSHDFAELGRISLPDELQEGYSVAVAQCDCGTFSFAANRDDGFPAEWLSLLKVATAISSAAVPHVESWALRP